MIERISGRGGDLAVGAYLARGNGKNDAAECLVAIRVWLQAVSQNRTPHFGHGHEAWVPPRAGTKPEWGVNGLTHFGDSRMDRATQRSFDRYLDYDSRNTPVVATSRQVLKRSPDWAVMRSPSRMTSKRDSAFCSSQI